METGFSFIGRGSGRCKQIPGLWKGKGEREGQGVVGSSCTSRAHGNKGTSHPCSQVCCI